LVVDTKEDFFPVLRDVNRDQAWPIFPAIDPTAKIVRIKRRNIFAQIVSLELAQQTNSWAVRNPKSADGPRLNGELKGEPRARWQAPSRDPDPILIDAETILRRIEYELEKSQALDDLIQSTSSPLTFFYEDMFDSAGQWQEAVIFESAKLLGVPRESFDTTPRLAKQNKFANSDLIENYGDIQRVLAETPHVWMLERV
jgi:hypothetical protein